MSIYKTIYKKFLAATTAAAIMATVAAPAASANTGKFTDVSGIYSVPVDYLSGNDVVNGTSATTFGTNNSIKRGDTAVIIARALGLDTNNVPDAGFKDVGRYAPSVNALSKEGVISGVSATEFNPNGTLSRGAMAKILVEAYNIPSATKAAPFTDAVGTFGNYIDALYATGITGGKSPGTFGTNDKITRGEFAVLLFKTIAQFGQSCDYDSQSTVNPDAQTINCLITEVARESAYTIPPEIVKAVAEEESGWKQFDQYGKPVYNTDGDGGIGLMQITRTEGYDVERLKYDIRYNIQAGIDFLVFNFYKRTDLPKINNHDPENLESWYFAVMAYNGTVPANSPVKQETGERNIGAYQEKVYANLENGNQLDTSIDKLLMKPEDFDYDRNFSTPIKFIKKSFVMNESLLTPTNQLFEPGDVVAYSGKGLRSIPSATTGVLTPTKFGDKMKIIGKPFYDNNPNSSNHFVWYAVQMGSKIGYIASQPIIR